MLGGILAVVIVLLFLRNWRSTLVAAVALPTSVIGTFAVMQALGFTFNVVTMLALTLSIGLLIDDAIVVIENIVRHLEAGRRRRGRPRARAPARSRLAVLAVTLAIVAVFVPVAFMEGIMGRVLLPVRRHRRGGGAHLVRRVDDAHPDALGAHAAASTVTPAGCRGPSSACWAPSRRSTGGRSARCCPTGSSPWAPRWRARAHRLHGRPAQVHLHPQPGHEPGEGHGRAAERRHRSRIRAVSSTTSPRQIRAVPGVSETFAVAGGGAQEEVHKGEITVNIVAGHGPHLRPGRLQAAPPQDAAREPRSQARRAGLQPDRRRRQPPATGSAEPAQHRLRRAAPGRRADAPGHGLEPRLRGRGHHLALRQAAARRGGGSRAGRRPGRAGRAPWAERARPHGRRQGGRLPRGRRQLRHQGEAPGRGAGRSRPRWARSRCARPAGSWWSCAASHPSSRRSARRRSSTRRRCGR